MSKQNSFVPNSFQTPNDYVDRVMPYLSGEEYKVLLYATRRILGFQKRQDRISISQFRDGTVSKKGIVLDRGTGLSGETIKKCLAALVDFGLMVRVAENDTKTNEGTLWSLQWNGRKVNWKALEARDETRTKAYAERMAKARSMRQTPPNGIEGTPPNGIEGTPPNGIETQNTEETQGNPEIDLAADQEVFRALESLMGALPSGITRYVDTWLEKHPLEKILEAIDIAREKGARSEKYIDKILIGWEANGYPKTREEQVKDRRTRGKSNQSNNQSILEKWIEGA